MAKKTHDTDPAAALIASVSGKGHAPDPSPEALAALRKIWAHNDTRPKSGSGAGRVTRVVAVEMLATHYGWAHGEHALEALCRRLGRKSWGTP